jgi:Mg-chelatase subunit ChlD
MDSSGSIAFDSPLNWGRMKEFLKSVTGQLYTKVASESDLHVGVVVYSTDATVAFGLSVGVNKASVYSQIDNLQYTGGSTNIAGGIELARTSVFNNPGDRPNVPNVLVLITDGQATVRQSETLDQATSAKNNKIFIVSVGITKEVFHEK